MNKLTFEEIKSIINSNLFDEHDHDPLHWMHEDVYFTVDELIENDGKYGQTFTKEFKDEFAKLGKFDCIEHFGGEGRGDDYWTVYYFEDHDVYISFDGWYASHHGSEYNDMSEVRPKEVVKREWEAV